MKHNCSMYDKKSHRDTALDKAKALEPNNNKTYLENQSIQDGTMKKETKTLCTN